MNIYVGNLSFDTTEDQLRQTFGEYGEVSSAKIVTDRYTGKSRGFGFVEMPNGDQGQAAVAALNNAEFQGRNLNVSEARPRNDQQGGGPRGGGGDRGRW